MKNTVVQYQGGGHDGCFWEWNFAYLDNDGQFHNIHSSGSNGCESMERLKDALGEKETYLYDISTAEGLKEIQTEVHIDLQRDLAHWIYENTEFELFLICGTCENETDYDDIILEGLEGAGGIAVQHSEMICTECHSIHSCDHCGDYSKGDMEYHEHRDQDLCSFCFERLSRKCFDCGESEHEGALLNSHRLCEDCAPVNSPKKGERWQQREFNGKPVFVLC